MGETKANDEKMRVVMVSTHSKKGREKQRESKHEVEVKKINGGEVPK